MTELARNNDEALNIKQWGGLHTRTRKVKPPHLPAPNSAIRLAGI
jgi:hypothetical protein